MLQIPMTMHTRAELVRKFEVPPMVPRTSPGLVLLKLVNAALKPTLRVARARASTVMSRVPEISCPRPTFRTIWLVSPMASAVGARRKYPKKSFEISMSRGVRGAVARIHIALPSIPSRG